MSQATAIGWTDVTWNPTFGCSVKSTECRNCYAETIALKFGQSAKPWTPANAAENVILKPHKLREPLSNAKHWRGLGAAAALAGKRDGMLVFVNSMSDLFHEQIPNEYIAAVFGIMAAADRHTFQVLTKRPDRAVEWFDWYEGEAHDRELGPGVDPSSGLEDMPADLGFQEARGFGVELGEAHGIPWPLPNVWIGTSIGLRHFAGRADLLHQVPAAVRFISAEPLLGPLIYDSDLGMARDGWPVDPDDDYLGVPEHLRGDPYTPCWLDGKDLPELNLDGIDWVITGGESGAEHRPMDLDWCRDIRDVCVDLGVAYFHKQHGGHRPGGARELDGREWSQFPQVGDLR
jgi:protein gp37